MTYRDLYNIAIKIIGLLFLKDLINSIIQTVVGIPFWFDEGLGLGFTIGFVFLAGVYVVLVYLLIWRTDWLLSLFRLNDQRQLPFNMHRATLLGIAFCLVGLYMIVRELPVIVDLIIQLSNRPRFPLYEDNTGKLIVVSIAQIILGLVLIGSQHTLVAFLEQQSRKVRKKIIIPDKKDEASH